MTYGNIYILHNINQLKGQLLLELKFHNCRLLRIKIFTNLPNILGQKLRKNLIKNQASCQTNVETTVKMKQKT